MYITVAITLCETECKQVWEKFKVNSGIRDGKKGLKLDADIQRSVLLYP